MKNQKTFFDAIKKQDENKINDLLKNQPDLCEAKDLRGNTPLEIAIECGCAWLVETLLEHGADANAKDSLDGDRSLLSHAMFQTPVNFEIIGLLVAHGIDPSEGLDDATLTQNVDLVKYLIDLGATMSYMDYVIRTERYHGERIKRSDPGKIIDRMLREVARKTKSAE